MDQVQLEPRFFKGVLQVRPHTEQRSRSRGALADLFVPRRR